MSSISAVEAIRDALPTVRHAQMLFRMVEERLGEAARVESADGGKRLALFRRDGAEITPWPLLQLGTGGRLSTIVMLRGPAEPPPRPGDAPKLRGLRAGEVIVRDGPNAITVTYGEDGRWFETSRRGDEDIMADVHPILARRSAAPVELVAEYVESLAPGGPGRVHLRAPVPAVARVWNCGLYAVREALFEERIPKDARWVVADGYAGAAVAWGATREEAMARWHDDVERVQPRLPEPAAPMPPPPEGATVMRPPSSDAPPADRAPACAPAVVIPIDPMPKDRPPRGVWTRLLGPFGTTRHAVRWRERGGFILLGDVIARRVDPLDIDRRLDAVALPAGPQRPGLTSRVVEYRQDESGTLAFSAASYTEEFRPRTLDGDRCRDTVVRQRRLAPNP